MSVKKDEIKISALNAKVRDASVFLSSDNYKFLIFFAGRKILIKAFA